MRKILIFSLVSVLLLALISSCAWMGRVAGKTVATGENVADSIGDTINEKQERVKDGYDEGYEQKKK